MKTNYRRCLSCRRVGPKDSFWRIVRVYPSRQVQLDEGMGRSAYLCPGESCLSRAQSKNRLGRSLRAYVPQEIYQSLWQRLSSVTNKEAISAVPKNNCPGHSSDRAS
ncbi:MAG: YlxR family protein [Oscillatoria sp. PMC 1051.18]|nr:YlxR family protein [Oscillatoria sp. PMC 1050.18]MEC5030045.1 YlxR family protein [Oscillatoria sp. PMC 1051.18]